MHLVCGIAAGIVILVMSVTGVLLTYQKQMTQWADREYWVAPRVATQRASLSDIVTDARAYDPSATVSSVTFHADPVAPVAVSLGRGRIVYLDPSTADVRGEGSQNVRAFFDAVVGWHRWFNITGDGRANARAITGWSNLAFLFLVLSGLYLWVPRRWSWQHVKPVLLFNRRATGKARDFNWHHVFGFWMSIPLAIVVASATVISFPRATDLAYWVMGEGPPRRLATPSASSFPGPTPTPIQVASLNQIVDSARVHLATWRTISVSVPPNSDGQVTIRIDQGWSGQPQKRTTVAYAAKTGDEISRSTLRDETPGRRLRTQLRFAHTGEYYGLFGQTVAGAASLAGIFLVWSGFALAWRRLKRTGRVGSVPGP
jgi:uncharacterized iron-regulated membrane protein